MTVENYTVVFDVTQAGYRQWWFPAVGLIFVALALPVVIYKFLRPSRKFRKLDRLLPFIIMPIALLWPVVTFAVTFSDYIILRNGVRNGTCEIVEGTVSNFVPMPYQGHAVEHFVVNGHYYEYSDFRVMAGFNQTKSHGGPIDEGRRVRICDVRGEIARLEVSW